MNQSPAVESSERLERLEQETERLATLLKQSSSQISVLQLVVLLLLAGLIGGGYYLIIKTGKLRVEGFSPAVAAKVETKDFGFYNRFDTRVMFDADDKVGNPQIIFLDANKRLRMRLIVFPDGGTAGLAFYDHTGWRGALRLDGDQNAVLNLRGEGQKGGISLAVAPDGTPSLKLTDKAGKVLWEAPTKAN